MILIRTEEEPVWFCGHCEYELPTEPYLAHIKACLDSHIANWPIHEPNWGAIGASGCPELCGKPHGEVWYRCAECGRRYKEWGAHKHEGSAWRE